MTSWTMPFDVKHFCDIWNDLKIFLNQNGTNARFETKKLFRRSNLSFSPPYLAFKKEIFS